MTTEQAQATRATELAALAELLQVTFMLRCSACPNVMRIVRAGPHSIFPDTVASLTDDAMTDGWRLMIAQEGGAPLCPVCSDARGRAVMRFHEHTPTVCVCVGVYKEICQSCPQTKEQP